MFHKYLKEEKYLCVISSNRLFIIITSMRKSLVIPQGFQTFYCNYLPALIRFVSTFALSGYSEVHWTFLVLKTSQTCVHPQYANSTCLDACSCLRTFTSLFSVNCFLVQVFRQTDSESLLPHFLSQIIMISLPTISQDHN